MAKELLMGNAAIGLGAVAAGVEVVTGYPGTPSTEVLETIAKNNDGSVYAEWSVNEKVALEVGAGVAYTGKRVLVTMKQVGLNVASDPLMSLAYLGVKGGMVVLVADDPGPISSQTEQDTRTFGMYSKLPVFDPSSPEEAYEMIGDAFNYSEKYGTPVIFRPTTRVCHACAPIELKACRAKGAEGFFVKDQSRVIFPRLSYQAHLNIEKRNPEIGRDFSSYKFNTSTGSGTVGIATGGVSFAFVKEFVKDDVRLLKVATPFPFPEDLALEFLKDLDRVLVIEELDPVIERALIHIKGKYNLKTEILGKLTGFVQCAGENTPETVKKQVNEFLGITSEPQDIIKLPSLPVRPPVLCAGCPHRASFYAVKKAAEKTRAVFCGDIGCYTLGNAKPLDMVDTCLCMGAGITVAQGISRGEPGAKTFAFIGDSTFFHTGIPGIINAVYNGANLTAVVLDNSTTAMTGHQPHPGTGVTMMGDVAEKISIEKTLEGIGVRDIQIVDPLDTEAAVAAARHCVTTPGVSAIIYRSPCIAVVKTGKSLGVNEEKCRGCKKCISELGCPALSRQGDKVTIDSSLCTGCGLCQRVCPFGAIGSVIKAEQNPKAYSVGFIGKQKTERSSLNCLLAGVGGQGTVLASKLLAQCAINKGLTARTAETIGMAQRGGSVVSHVRIGEKASSPLIPLGTADLIIALEPGEAVRVLPYLKKDGAVIFSTSPIKPVTDQLAENPYDSKVMEEFLKEHVKCLIPVDGKAICSEIGSQKVLNLALLGVAAQMDLLGFSVEELVSVIDDKIPEKFRELNRRAVSLGK